MVGDIRLLRLTELVRERATRAILYELKDPRLGFLTVSRVSLAKDLTMCTVFWSIIGTPGEKSKTAHALESARGYVQAAIAKEMGTRVTPRIRFEFDPSYEKAAKVHGILAKLRREREERGEPPVAGDGEE